MTIVEIIRQAAADLRRNAGLYDTRDSEFCQNVADWLEHTADLAPPDPHHEGEACETCENVTHAFAVAVAYLGDGHQ